MTKVESSGSDTMASRSQHRKEKQRVRQKKEKVKLPTKIIVRHLPPTMTEEEFHKQIELPEHDGFYYATPDWSLGNCASCRAYVTLKQYDDVFLFRDRFDGYVFVDSKGAEYPAIVEFAPFQGLLKNRSRRNDHKANTIEEESHYQQFLAKLQEERDSVAKGSDIKLEFSLDRKKEITSTPLLQYLAMKKEKRREEAKKRTEEKRRQKEDEKERRRQQQQPQVTKIMSAQGSSKVNSAGTGADNKGKESNVAGTERKNARARRKALREQKRREQRDKTSASAKMDEKPENSEATTAADEKPPHKESKKYSEKRERERERNRNRKEKEKEKEKEKQKPEASSSTTTIGIAPAEAEAQAQVETEAEAEADAESKTKQKSKDEQISDTVLNFIRSVASVKEFVPKHKQTEQKDPEHTNSDKNEIFEIKKSSSNDSNSEINFEKEKSKDNQDKKSPDRESASSSKKEESERQKREERRIRNKDRPSIAIYQPKPRLQRTSEETDSNAASNKDPRSNPTSDCESVKKDDSKKKKKVSRYSERSERASCSKSKQNERPGDGVKELSKSPSIEDSSKSDAALEEKMPQDDPKHPKNEENSEKQEA